MIDPQSFDKITLFKIKFHKTSNLLFLVCDRVERNNQKADQKRSPALK